MSAEISRRGFLRLFGSAAAVAAAPTYFLPPIGGWKSDVIIQPPHTGYHYSTIKADDLVCRESTAIYYDKKFLDSVRSNMNFALMAEVLFNPAVRTKLDAEGLQLNEKRVVEMFMYGL